MKNLIQRSISLSAFLMLFAFTGELKAQIWPCPYKIINATGCNIRVNYRVSCGSTLCTPVNGVLIAPSATLVIPCSSMDPCCPGPWDCAVTIVSFAGFPVSNPQTVDSSVLTSLSWGPCAGSVPASCCASASFNITWGSMATTIN